MIVCVVALFPVYWMVLSTFQPAQDSLTYPPDLLPHGIQFGTITSLFARQPDRLLAAPLPDGVAICVAVTLIFAVPGAYLLSRLRWHGVGGFGFLLLFTQLMPGAMIVVPELQFYRQLGWTNNLLALGVLYAAFNVPLGCWILKSSFDSVPSEVIDARWSTDAAGYASCSAFCCRCPSQAWWRSGSWRSSGAGTTTCSQPRSSPTEPVHRWSRHRHLHQPSRTTNLQLQAAGVVFSLLPHLLTCTCSATSSGG